MPHSHATLAEHGRMKLARFHVAWGPVNQATAERFQVSTTLTRSTMRLRVVLTAGEESST